MLFRSGESQKNTSHINTARETKETGLHWISSKYLWGYCYMCKFDKRTRQQRSNKYIDTSPIDSSNGRKSVKRNASRHARRFKGKECSPQLFDQQRRNALANLKSSPKVYGRKGNPIPKIYSHVKAGD